MKKIITNCQVDILLSHAGTCWKIRHDNKGPSILRTVLSSVEEAYSGQVDADEQG